MSSKPLDGIRIIDATTILAAPYALGLLGDMGADVIKVEAHTRNSRVGGQLFHNERSEQFWNESAYFNIPNRSKRGITLDLKAPEGIEAFYRLVDVSDIVVENNRPGAAKRLGIDYETLSARKPDIIMLSNSGFGQTGPWQFYGGIGRMLELTTGLSSMSGYPDTPPQRVGMSFVDLQVSYAIVGVVTAALIHREKTGRGQYIDLSMYQIGVSMIGDALLEQQANGEQPPRIGNRDRYRAPQGVYPCQGENNWVALSIRDDAEWNKFCQLIGQPAAAKASEFADSLSRWENQDEIDPLIAAWTSEHTAEDAMEQLQAIGLPAGKLLDGRELVLNEQLIAIGFWEPVTHPEPQRLGTRIMPGRPYRFSETPVRIERPAPTLGEHNREVLGELLGYSDAEIDALEEKNVIGQNPVFGPSRRGQGRHMSIEEEIAVEQLEAYDPNFEEVLAETFGLAQPTKRA